MEVVRENHGVSSSTRGEYDDMVLRDEKLYHNWVASRKTQMRWFLKEANSRAET